jgi:hypothetical protein
VPGLAVTIDGVAAAPGSLSVDGGTHRIGATAPARVPWHIELDTAADGATHTVTVPDLEVLADEDIPNRVSQPVASTSDGLPPTGTTQRAIGLSVTGAGIVALGAGAYFGVRAISKNAQAADVCSGRQCQTDEGVRLRSDAVAAGNVATVTFLAGGAAVISGIIIWLTAPRTAAARGAARLEAVPRLSRGGAGVVLGGRW